MAYSIQREVSDGTLQTLTLRITYFKKTHIFVYVDDTIADGSAGYSWIWDGERIRLNKVVPVGIEVMIRRKTPMDAPFHNFRQGAVFKDVTMDENFIQQLYINQENVEGLSATDFYSDLDLHNYRLKNVGTAITDTDVVTLGQYRADALGANQYRILAENSKVAAKAAEVASAASAQIATTASRDAGSASVSAANSAASVGQAEQRVLVLRDQAKTFSDYSATYAANSKASADLANGSEADARNSVTLAVKEADRAKAEAERAGSIVGFEEVPFPEVWIPFSDDLSMLAGQNQAKMPVKLGDDTILIPSNKWVSFERASTATYIDKSGVLRTAAIGEPRFEKEGLLVEGQSTNLLPVVGGVGVTIFRTEDSIPAKILIANLVTNTVYTASVEVRCTGSIADHVLIGAHIPIREGLSKDWVRVTVSWNEKDNQYPKQMILNSPVAGVEFRHYQVEALPFATSYIPTNGAATTRAADRCSIKSNPNFPLSLGLTIVADFDTVGGKSGDGSRTICSFPSSNQYDCLRFNSETNKVQSLVYGIPDEGIISNSPNGLIGVVVEPDSRRRVFIDGLFSGRSEPTWFKSLTELMTFGYMSGAVDRVLNGHIRNFRIWHSALTDAQLKGLK